MGEPMAKLVCEDGYNLPFVTTPEVRGVDGNVLYSLPVVSGRYRPPVYEDREAFVFAYGRCGSGDERANLVSAFIAARVVEWDVAFVNGSTAPKPAPVTAEFIRKNIPEPIVNKILDLVSVWGPKSQGEAAGNS